MKIAIIGTTAASMISFRKELIKFLCCNGHEVYAFAIDYDDDIKNKITEYGAIPIDYNFSRTGLNPFTDIINTIKLSKQLKKLNPGLVFSYFSKPAIFGTLAAKLAGVKKINAMLEGLGYFFTVSDKKDSLKLIVLRRILLFLYRLSFRYLDNLIFLNADDKNDLLGKTKMNVKNVTVLGAIGLDINEYPYIPPPVDPISFIFVARFLQEKGVNEFIQAAKIVKEKFPDTHFYMLGDLDVYNPGSLSIDNFNQLKKSGFIELPGHVDNVQDWLAKASVFVLPSYREGFPRSTQEAMAMGRAVITSDVPGCRETVVDGVNGFLIPPRTSADLAERMLRFLHNPDLITTMGTASHEIARARFDSAIVNNKLLSILQLDKHRC
ncbi:glycosyltransferase family 4 protein [Kluyvera cryocrescens]|uniref:glycosyltransferase family 4 protein n=1 Tax=Kluyvera cryocrescens TaxID=580 RepID=UPI002DB6F5CD|nr:glycosyltransferase family 4 protein [Kluyvera cryocrescens]MEB7558528.1 glycosyltransferase family 4 protein [Kluyvera cryocrescens]